MQFIDEVVVRVTAGAGGNGSVAFRREKYVPFGGPAGGDGGDGGDVVFVAKSGMSTLLDLQHRAHIRAERGEHGRGKDQYGAAGEPAVVGVPCGTQVFDAATGALLADLDTDGKEVVIAKGGRGGRGNIHFATPTDRAPRRAEPGEPGEDKEVRLELKSIADVGILGFPNVGKSTFIAKVSKARPKIADYPFTTLVPNLGVVSLGQDRSFVVADIPGIIEGAAEGVGLGLRFLRHVERTKVLLHMVALDPGEGREPLRDFGVLMREVERFRPELLERPMVVALAKADLPDTREAYPGLKRRFARKKIRLHLMSAATGEGVEEVLLALEAALRTRTEGEALVDGATAPSTKEPNESAERRILTRAAVKRTDR